MVPHPPEQKAAIGLATALVLARGPQTGDPALGHARFGAVGGPWWFSLPDTFFYKREMKEKRTHLEQGGDKEKPRSSHKQKNEICLEDDLNGCI